MTDDRADRVVADGGPLDGRELDLPTGADQIVVTMADDTRHVYVRTVRTVRGRPVVRWAGRR